MQENVVARIKEVDDNAKLTYAQTFTVPLNGVTDSAGNFNTGIDKTIIPPIAGIVFDPDATSYDGLYIPFISPVTNLVYFHVTDFNQTTQAGVTVKGNMHITRRA